jgi:hypothetical protein
MTSSRAHRIRHGVLALVLCAGASRAAADSAEAMQWLLSGNRKGAGAAINEAGRGIRSGLRVRGPLDLSAEVNPLR